jgi:hypothetical protein
LFFLKTRDRNNNKKKNMVSVSNLTCNPDKDGWLSTRAATSSVLLPLMFAVTCHESVKTKIGSICVCGGGTGIETLYPHRELTTCPQMRLKPFKNLFRYAPHIFPLDQ